MQAEGEPLEQSQGTRCLGQDFVGLRGALVASLLRMLVLLDCSLSTVCEREWGTSGGPLCFCPISSSGEGCGGPLCPLLQPPHSLRQRWELC